MIDNYIYTFNEDKTCEYNAIGTILKCTYEISEDNLSILYDGETKSYETKYKIDNKKLIITDSYGTKVEYERN